MKIGIIGCGYVGQAVASRWIDKGHIVSATTRKPIRLAALEHLALHPFLIQNGNLKPFIESQEAILISLAPNKTTDDYTATYLKTTQQIVQALDSSPSLKQILYTSSTSVYGDQQGAWTDETAPLNFFNGQARILYETEQLLLQQDSEHLSVCILRLGEIYGPRREISARLHRMQGHPFPGTGANYTNLIHLEDIVEALDFALNHNLRGIYNLCNDLHISRRQLYAALCEQEKLAPIQWDPLIQSQHGGNKRVSNQKIKNLGFSFSKNTVI